MRRRKRKAKPVEIDPDADAFAELFDRPGHVIICQGIPHCPFDDQSAFEAQLAGCPICRRYIPNLDGTDTEYRAKPH